MPKYRVPVELTLESHIVVEADDREGAVQKVISMLEDGATLTDLVAEWENDHEEVGFTGLVEEVE